ncbi:uncharacterized protein LOC143561050 [Bidens hawaiensis]|uniref:uncharacterized protein LOC143561050 n=1 Tax=Bidens hawaiensis TaxID=980011 RepID=UPI00404AB751
MEELSRSQAEEDSNQRPPEEEGWEQVTGDTRSKNIEGANKEKGHPTNTVRFFVSNLPDDCNRKEVSVFFGVFGSVSDVYIARKKDKGGNSFGFDSFSKVDDVGYLEAKLKYIKMGKQKLFVKVAMFAEENGDVKKRNQKRPTETPVAVDIKKPSARERVDEFQKSSVGNMVEDTWKPGYIPAWKMGRSYKEACINSVDGGSKALEVEVPTNINAFEHLHRRALVGVTVDLGTLRNLKSLLKDAGIVGLNIHYIGGFHVYLAFDGLKAAEEFLKNKDIWAQWFTKLDEWRGQSLPFQRNAWLRVIRVPLHLSDEEVFNSVGSMLGKVIHKSQISWNNGDMSIDCIGVLVGDGRRITEEIKLKWRNKSFLVWVTEEIGIWDPECVGRIEMLWSKAKRRIPNNQD